MIEKSEPFCWAFHLQAGPDAILQRKNVPRPVLELIYGTCATPEGVPNGFGFLDVTRAIVRIKLPDSPKLVLMLARWKLDAMLTVLH